ncbi:MAG TPA: succinylglutamate desuccinylase/aspartoacylase family protein [Trichocoleus sp.]
MQPLITTLPLMQMASGDELALQLYRFVGESPGKTVYLQANLHGAEISGNTVIHRLIAWLETLEPSQIQGEIQLVPVCNPIGVNTRSYHFATGRYNPYDGRDWNRIFWDYSAANTLKIARFAQAHLEADLDKIQQAYRSHILAAFAEQTSALAAPTAAPAYKLYRAQLQGLALRADYVIDLHSSSNQGLTYLYYFSGRAESARLFGLDFAILLDEYDGDAFDEAFTKPWLALEQAFADLGRELRFEVEAYTLELGTSMETRFDAVERGVRGIQHYLEKKGIVPPGLLPVFQSGEAFFSRTSQLTKYFAPTGGFLQQRAALGTWVRSGTPLYSLLRFNKSGQLPEVQTVRAQEAGLVYDLSINQAFNQGEYVLATLQPDV